MVGMCALFLSIYLCLRLLNWGYFFISSEQIKFHKRNQEAFSIQKESIVKLSYVKWRPWDPMVMGSGYLHIEHKGGIEETKKLSFHAPYGNTIYPISMSFKQAQDVAKLLDMELDLR